MKIIKGIYPDEDDFKVYTEFFMKFNVERNLFDVIERQNIGDGDYCDTLRGSFKNPEDAGYMLSEITLEHFIDRGVV